jgi:hypothetical protein
LRSLHAHSRLNEYERKSRSLVGRDRNAMSSFCARWARCQSPKDSQ